MQSHKNQGRREYRLKNLPNLSKAHCNLDENAIGLPLMAKKCTTFLSPKSVPLGYIPFPVFCHVIYEL